MRRIGEIEYKACYAADTERSSNERATIICDIWADVGLMSDHAIAEHHNHRSLIWVLKSAYGLSGDDSIIWQAKNPPLTVLQKIGLRQCAFGDVICQPICGKRVGEKYVLCKYHQMVLIRAHQQLTKHLHMGLTELCINYIAPDYEKLEMRSKRHERRCGFPRVTIYDLVRPW